MDYIHILTSKCKPLSKLKKYSFDERYIATDTGRIYLIKRIEKNTYMCKALKPYIDRQGYVEYVLTDTQGIKHLAKRCILLQNNQGIIFAGIG